MYGRGLTRTHSTVQLLFQATTPYKARRTPVISQVVLVSACPQLAAENSLLHNQVCPRGPQTIPAVIGRSGVRIPDCRVWPVFQDNPICDRTILSADSRMQRRTHCLKTREEQRSLTVPSRDTNLTEINTCPSELVYVSLYRYRCTAVSFYAGGWQGR